MAHLAFVAPPFLGHLNPMAALAGELARRGHRATFFGEADAGRLVAERGFGFVPLGARTHPPGHLAATTRRMAGTSGLFGIGAVIRDMAAATDMLADELPDALRAHGIDGLVVDQTEAAGGLAARALGLPYLSVANALPLNGEPLVPPPFTPWRYGTSGWARERNLGGYRVSALLLRPLSRVIARHAARLGLGELRTPQDCLSSDGQISQTVAGFDMPRLHPPAGFHHVGPLRRPRSGASEFRLAPDGRPLVYASFGTLQGGRIGMFRRVAEAARRLDLRLVIAHGGLLGAREVASLPGDPAVFGFVPQDEVLRHASLAVLHGGLNTVMDALAAGVPIVALPIAFEQGAIAARIERAGAGRIVSRRLLTAGRLARAMSSVLSDPACRRAAAGLASAIAGAGGAGRAACIVEAVVGRCRALAPEHAE